MASEIVAAAGSPCRVMPVRSSAYPSKVRRPSYSVLDKSKIREHYGLIIPHWRTSLNNCISKINRI
jgi:dTDP-4-dehydrorhamnose reductase